MGVATTPLWVGASKSDERVRPLGVNRSLKIMFITTTIYHKQFSEFTELTLMTDHTAHIKIDPLEIPYRIFSDYLVHIMFPNVDKRKILSNLQVLFINHY